MILRALARQLLHDLPEVPNGLRQRHRHPCVQAMFHLQMAEFLEAERPIAWRPRRAWHELQRRRFTALCSAKRAIAESLDTPR